MEKEALKYQRMPYTKPGCELITISKFMQENGVGIDNTGEATDTAKRGFVFHDVADDDNIWNATGSSQSTHGNSAGNFGYYQPKGLWDD